MNKEKSANSKPSIDHEILNSSKNNPVDSANIFSVLSYSYLDSVFWKGYRNPLEVDDLYKTPKTLTSVYNVNAFEVEWEKELKKGNLDPSYTPNLSTAGMLKVLGDTAVVLSPLVLSSLIKYIALSENNRNTPVYEGILYVLAMFLLSIFNTVLINYYFQTAQYIGTQTQTALSTAIYKKSLRLSAASRQDFNAGKVTTVVSTDCFRIQLNLMFINVLWTAPIQILLILIMMVISIGPAAIAGVGLLILLTPVQTVLYKKLSLIRKVVAPITDERVKLTQEILSGIRIIKFFSWETSFLKKLQTIRELELKQIFRRGVLTAIVVAIVFGIPVFCSTLSFTIYGITRELKAQDIFPTLTWFGQLRFPLMFLPNVLVGIAEYRVAIERIQKLLLAPELESQPEKVVDSTYSVQIENGEFLWESPPPDIVKDDEKNSKKNSEKVEEIVPTTHIPTESTLKNINIKIPHGSLVAIVGKVGSGKSSLLNALIGEMKKVNGSIKISGSMGYAPQQAWIQNASLQNNILFGQNMDRNRYVSTLRDCALERDLEVLPNGDQTEIGEKGINLSGGQKQRVNLARCVYYNSDVVLMDDPLSAVDAHVGKALFENCILTALKGKTRLLVTHQLHFLPKVDYVIVMKDGAISETGSYAELIESQGEFSKLMSSYGGVEEEESAEADNDVDHKENMAANDRIDATVVKNIQNPAKALMSTEERNVGRVTGATWFAYIKNSGGPLLVFIYLLNLIINQGTALANNYWLVVWESEQIPGWSQVQYIGVFWIWGVAQTISLFFLVLTFAFASLYASRNLHNNAASRILRAPVLFFDTTPLGRIINRFSKDLDAIDTNLAEAIRMFTMTFAASISSFVLIVYATPLFGIIILPLLIIYYFMQSIYRTTGREIKRLDSVSRSPLYSHFGETLQGLSTIRAYNEQEKFISVLHNRLDATNQPYFILIAAQRWLGLRLEALGALVVFFAGIFGVLARHSISPSILGLSLSYAIQITGILSWCVRQFAETEIAMNAVERINYYGTEIDMEADPIIENSRPPPNWPSTGVIKFENLDVKYSKEHPLVLKNVDFTIGDKEKIGVIGRTGSGKSTMMNALFRIMEPSNGSIVVDGVNIRNIGLADLRKGLAIIPQDPMLFSGTFRSNLDPFGEHSDNELWDALERSNMKAKVLESEGSLDAPILEGGENLSVGQRQLLCLGRAMLKKPRILVMDEATANVDYETDSIIQRSLREDFKDATILTIAHRLNTIIDYDKVLVLDNGVIVEIGTPKDLLNMENGKFKSMVDETGSANSELLKSLAR
ncbi:hypothetical protein HDU92_007577 [Lobulomyces angularis]|nr:hypothetical protein HDU92_007577 [Lobulomyces angularis]